MNEFGMFDKKIAREVGISEAVIFQRLVELSEKGFLTLNAKYFMEDYGLNRRELNKILLRLQEAKLVECDLYDMVYKILDNINYPTYKGKLRVSNKPRSNIRNRSKIKVDNIPEYDLVKKILDEGGRIFKNHRLNENNPTVLIKRTIRFIEMLENGTFLDNIKLSDTQKISDKSKLEIFNKPMLLSDVEELILKSLEGIRVRRGEQYYPTNKSVLENMSIDNFFYNPRTEYSWLIESIVNEPSLIISVKAERAFKTLPSVFCDVFKRELGFDSLVESDKIKFSEAVTNFYWEYKDLASRYENIYKNTNWLNYYSTESGFATQICYYIKHYHVTAPMSYVKSKDFWERFVKWANDFHHVNLNPSFDFLMSLKKNFEAELARKSSLENMRKEVEEERKKRNLQDDFENL